MIVKNSRLTLLTYSLLVSTLGYSEQECFLELGPYTTPTERFEIYEDGTVYDTSTNLMWQRCPLSANRSENCGAEPNQTITWDEALLKANDSKFADYDDWRLPNIKELISINEYSCNNPQLNLNVFFHTPVIDGKLNSYPEKYLSSSPYLSSGGDFGSGDSVLSISATDGSINGIKKNDMGSVRLVRVKD